MVNTNGLSTRQLHQRRARSFEAPHVPPLSVQRALAEAMPRLPVHSEWGDTQLWAKCLAQHRFDLRNAIIVVEEDDKNQAFWFLFAALSPGKRAYFAVLEVVEPALPLATPTTPFGDRPGLFCTDRHISKISDREKWAILSVSCLGNGLLVSDQSPHPMSDLVLRLGNGRIECTLGGALCLLSSPKYRSGFVFAPFLLGNKHIARLVCIPLD